MSITDYRLPIRIALVLAVSTLSAQQALSPALQSMVDAEKAFARSATQRGIRDSFLEFFSDDSIALVPDATSAVERLRGQTARPFSELELVWEPRAGDIAASGDFGWLTGPSTFVDRTVAAPAPSYGNYLSIWRRSGTGPWKVFIDFGNPVPSAAPFPPGFTHVQLPGRYTRGGNPAEATSALSKADVDLNGQIAAVGLGRAFAAAFAAESRLHRRGALPRVGRAAITEYANAFDRGDRKLACTAAAAGSAASGDLGYSYGVCTVAAAAPAPYVRVWARDAEGKWWLVVEAGSAE